MSSAGLFSVTSSNRRDGVTRDIRGASIDPPAPIMKERSEHAIRTAIFHVVGFSRVGSSDDVPEAGLAHS